MLAMETDLLEYRGGGPQTIKAAGRRATRAPRLLVVVNSSSNASASLVDSSLKSVSKERLEAEDGAADAGSTPNFRIRRTSPLLDAGT